MRTEIDPVTGTQAGAAPLGVEERSDEAPRGEVGQDRPVPDPEVVAKPMRRQFTAEYRLRVVEEADRCTRPGEVGRKRKIPWGQAARGCSVRSALRTWKSPGYQL